MKKYLLYALLCLCPCWVHAQDHSSYERHWKKNVEKIRIMSYNILNGFDWGNDTEREDRLVEWVKAQDPEILGLQELCGFTQEKLSQLAARWGHPYALIVKEDGYPVGITSKQPLDLQTKIAGKIGHGLLHVRTYGFDVLVTHLNPLNTVKRNAEAKMVVDYIREHQLNHCILMGDMNSHSPMDADYLETHATRLTATYGGADSPNLLDGEIDYSVISHYLSVPLIDVCSRYVAPEKRFSFPTPILMEQSKHPEVRKRINERLDYILVSPSVAKMAVDGFIFNEGPTEYLSDHFPIAIDLILEKSVEKE